MLPLVSVLALVGTAAGHGYVSSPAVRQPGDAAVAACGTSVVNEIVRDNTSHVEGLPELAAEDSGYNAEACNLWLCRGLQFADNVASTQAYRAGESVNIRVKLTIPHSGNANVSVVDTATNTVVGEPLIRWDEGYADEQAFYADATPEDQVDFNVTIPSDLDGRCAQAGACVLQWWWYGTGAKQSYESCVDFTVTAAA